MSMFSRVLARICAVAVALPLALGAAGGDGITTVGVTPTIGRTLPSAVSIAVFGDSNVANTDSSSVGAAACTTLCLGDNATGSYFGWVNAFTNGRVARVPNTNNFGENGDTTATMMARIGAVVSSSADIILMQSGANDSTIGGLTCAQSAANNALMYRQLLAAGKTVIKNSIFPRIAPSAYTATQNAIAQCINWSDRHFAERAGNRGFIFIDLDPTLIDTTAGAWAPLANVLAADGVHLSTLGSWLVGQQNANRINALVSAWRFAPVGQFDVYDATNFPNGNMAFNPGMTGTGGAVTGACASAGGTGIISNVTLQSSNFTGGTCVGTLTGVATAQSQVITLGGSYNNTNATVDLSGLNNINVIVGDTIEFAAYVSIGTNTNVAGIGVYLLTTENGVTFSNFGGAPTNTVAIPGAGTGGVIRLATPRRTIGASPITVVQWGIRIYLLSVGGATSPTGAVTISGMELRKVLP